MKKTIEVTEPVQTTEKKTKYTHKYLKHQKQAIKDDRDKYVAVRNAEIEYINILLTECEKVGLIDEKEEDI